MRLFEFDEPTTTNGSPQIEIVPNLIMVLNVVAKRAENESVDASIGTDDLIAMVTNTGIQFDYQALVSAYENNNAVNNLIKNFSKDTVDLIGSSGDELDPIAGQGEDSQTAVGKIAARVANRNIG